MSPGDDTRATPAPKKATLTGRAHDAWGTLRRVSEPADPLVPLEPSTASHGEPAVATPPPASEGYDPVELRRRMAVCFSAPELRELAESLGVAGAITWDRGQMEAARELIRQFEKYYGLGILVAKLRALRPDVEWPEPALPALASPPPAPKTIADAPPRQEERDVRPTIHDPLAPPPDQAAREQPAPSHRAAPAWPGTAGPTPATSAASRAIDARVLIVVAGLTVLAALIAYAAGRASRPPSAAPEAAGSALPASSTALRRPNGPATHAADAFRRSLDRVVRGCDLPVSADRDASILGLALARCGLQLRAPLSALNASPPDPPLANGRAADPKPQGKARPTKPAKDPPPAKDPATAKADACLAGCDAERRSCNDHCGAEPLESSLYDGYMRCRSRCLSATSHCRLACP